MYNDLSLFSGVAGLEIGLQDEAQQVCAYVEREPYCQAVLARRMCEGHIGAAPIYGDINGFDARRYRGLVDRVVGGFPCQDISTAGKGAGIKEGTRSGLFFKMLETACLVESPILFMENVSAIVNRGMDTVLGSLAEAGYDAEWCTIRASDIGAHHRRERWFCLAYAKGRGTHGQEHRGQSDIIGSGQNVPYASEAVGEWFGDTWAGRSGLTDCYLHVSDTTEPGLQGEESEREFRGRESGLFAEWGMWDIDPADLPRTSESFVGRVAHGVPQRVDRLKCLGNAVVPLQAAAAWRILTEELADSKLRMRSQTT